MKSQLVSLACIAFLSVSCRSSHSRVSYAEVVAPSAEMQLWQQYVEGEVGADNITAECMPRIVRADTSVERQGMLMFFHGFQACPQQYAALSEKLSKAGFDVYLPLLPGHGRGARSDPAESIASYKKFLSQMNEVARLAPRGDKVLAGLSGGGSLATEAALTAVNVWDRVLVYAPRPGEELKSIGKIQVPLQLVSVAYEPTGDATALSKAMKSAKHARLCLYPEGIPHAMLDASADAYWMPAMQEDSLAFITQGRWFLTSGVTQEKSGLPICRYVL